MTSTLAFFLIFICHFNGWHGGWASGPRYLLPALPFLALPMAPVFTRCLRISCILAVISIAITFLTVAVDPMHPLGMEPQGFVYGRPSMSNNPVGAAFAYNPLTEYLLPFFFTGRDNPLVRANVDAILEQQTLSIQQGMVLEARQRLRAQLLA